MRQGIQTAKDGFNRVHSYDMTMNSTLANPLVETTANPRRFDTIEHTFKSEPAVSATTEIVKLPHGYDYRPVFFPYFSTNYQDRDLNRFALLRFLVFDEFSGDSTELYAYADSTYIYIKVKKGDGTGVAGLLNSKWIFSYRIYALDAGDV